MRVVVQSLLCRYLKARMNTLFTEWPIVAAPTAVANSIIEMQCLMQSL